MKHTFLTICFYLLGAFFVSAAEKPLILLSPDGMLKVEVRTEKGLLTYSVYRADQCLLKDSRLGMQLENGTQWGTDTHIRSQKRKSISEKIVSPNYRLPSFQSVCNELDLRMKGNYGIIFRVYNEGVAYRFYSTEKKPFIIQGELAEFNFDKDYTTYMSYSTAAKGKDPYAMAFQNLYVKAPLTAFDTDNVAFLPVTVDYDNGVKLTITESDLEAYPGMFIKGDGKTTSLKGKFAPYPSRMDYHPWRHMSYVAERSDYIAKSEGTRSFPWRILAVSENDTQMPLNNMVYALASPNRIGDYSWVKGGKVAWDWWNDWEFMA